MRAERIVSIALWAYPREVRRSRGEEMTATVLDLSEGSRWVFLRETLALVYGGLSARAGIDPEAGTRGLAESVRWRRRSGDVWSSVFGLALTGTSMKRTCSVGSRPTQ